MKRVITLLIGLIFLSNIQAQVPVTEKPLTELFGTDVLGAAWSEDSKLLNDNNAVEKPENEARISGSLKKMGELMDRSTIWGMIPGIFNVASRAPKPSQRIEALDTLRTVFLNEKASRVSPALYDRMTKELMKMLKSEKESGVKSAILWAIAYSGDPSAVQAFVDALEAGAKDKNFVDTVRDYLVRVGISQSSIPIPGFRKLYDHLAAAGARTERDMTEALMSRELVLRKKRVSDLNEKKGSPTFPKGSLHKKQ